MAPWSNRIQNARYTWMGQEYDLGPAPDGSREANHGLMLNTDFERIDDGQDPASLTLHTVTGGVEGYPWPLDVTSPTGSTKRPPSRVTASNWR